MSNWVTSSDFRQYATTALPTTPEADALIQKALDRAEALCGRWLLGVVIELPAPEDLIQIVLEVAWSIYITRGTASRLETVGAEGSGGFQYVGWLTNQQKAALRQIKIDLSIDGVAF